jgi:hypothetical protein
LPSRRNESCSALNSRALFGYPDWGFPWFSSVVRQTQRIYDVKSEHCPHSLPQAQRPHLSSWPVVAFATEPVWARNPDSQPTKVFPSHN